MSKKLAEGIDSLVLDVKVCVSDSEVGAVDFTNSLLYLNIALSSSRTTCNLITKCTDQIGGASTTESYEEAEWLARKMVEIGEGMGVDATAVLTEMDTPLGYAIGNSLEVLTDHLLTSFRGTHCSLSTHF